jgi:hypothetical protein
MLPPLIVVDPEHVDENGAPVEGATIYLNHIKVHPSQEKKVFQGLKGMYPNQEFCVERRHGKLR